MAKDAPPIRPPQPNSAPDYREALRQALTTMSSSGEAGSVEAVFGKVSGVLATHFSKTGSLGGAAPVNTGPDVIAPSAWYEANRRKLTPQQQEILEYLLKLPRHEAKAGDLEKAIWPGSHSTDAVDAGFTRLGLRLLELSAPFTVGRENGFAALVVSKL